MNVLTVILSPREIPEVLESWKTVPYPQMWIKGYTELEALKTWNRILPSLNFDGYIFCADDVIVNPTAYHLVKYGLNQFDVATGYCKLFQESEFINLSKTQIVAKNRLAPDIEDYHFIKESDLSEGWNETTFCGFALTGLRHELALKAKFQVNTFSIAQSDFEFSNSIINMGYKMYAHKSAYIHHLKSDLYAPYAHHWYHGEPKVELRYW